MAELAIDEVNEGLYKLKELFVEYDAEDQFDDDELVQRLTEFREGLREKYEVGLTLKETLEQAVADEDYELAALVTRELESFVENLEKIKLRDGIRNILSISKLGNQYMQANQPWVLVKGSSEEKLRAGTVVGLAANIACLLSVMIQPYMPETSKTVQDQLQAPSTCNILTPRFYCKL